ncbi:MAG: hypothetical protein WC495_04650 [Patescibacteria group bacterium]
MTFPFASQTCPFCDAITDGLTCKKCSQTKKLNGAISLFDYEHPGVQKLIAHIKYRGLFSLIATLTADTEDVLVSYENLFPLSAALVPAPLRKTSFIERGFNQAEVIAKMVSKITGMRISKNLAFSSRIRPQHLLSQNARWEKIDNRVTVRYLAKDIKHAIVVDDLLTTGATLESCAQALSQAGVKRITGFTLARQKKLFR